MPVLPYMKIFMLIAFILFLLAALIAGSVFGAASISAAALAYGGLASVALAFLL